jgi:hypothetical protein
MAVTTISTVELTALLAEAARGRFPLADWSLRLAPLAGPAAAVMAFTGCFVVSAPITPAWLETQLDVLDAGPLHPKVLARPRRRGRPGTVSGYAVPVRGRTPPAVPCPPVPRPRASLHHGDR